MRRFVRPEVESREQGFTLLELLFAMTIMGAGMLAVALAQVSALKVSSKARSLSQAMFLAQEQLDTFLALPGSNAFFTTAVTDNDDPLGALQINDADEDETSFLRRWTVAPDQPGTGLTTVTVSVEWATPSGLSHDIQLQGIKRR